MPAFSLVLVIAVLEAHLSFSPSWWSVAAVLHETLTLYFICCNAL